MESFELNYKKFFEGTSAINVSAWRKRPTKATFLRRLKRFLTEGYILDIKVVEEFVRDNVGDLTFQVMMRVLRNSFIVFFQHRKLTIKRDGF